MTQPDVITVALTELEYYRLSAWNATVDAASLEMHTAQVKLQTAAKHMRACMVALGHAHAFDVIKLEGQQWSFRLDETDGVFTLTVPSACAVAEESS